MTSYGGTSLKCGSLSCFSASLGGLALQSVPCSGLLNQIELETHAAITWVPPFSAGLAGDGPGSAAFGGPGFLDGEFGGRVRFQALVGDRLAAADRSAVGALV